jgi:hypothetical protein
MNGMKKMGTLVMALALACVCSCASGPGFTNYRQGMSEGYNLLSRAQYQPAIQQFMRASHADPTKAMPLALAGQAACQADDFAAASRYLAQAEGLVKGADSAYVIIKGLQAFIAFRENRQQDAMAALGEYVRVYYHQNPDSIHPDVERMYKSGDIDPRKLEPLIADQMNRYEDQLMRRGWTQQ